jgi:hypothetical protein
MFGLVFFILLDRIHVWLGDFFYHGLSVTEIEKMSYPELKYWYKWYEVIAKERKDKIDELNAKIKKLS